MHWPHTLVFVVAVASQRTSVMALTQLDVPTLNTTIAQMRHDEERITRLLTGRRCRHVYLDIGSNIGVQIRKLFEPRKYSHGDNGRRAEVLPIFDEIFGAAPRCHV